MKKINIIFGLTLGLTAISLPTILTSCNNPPQDIPPLKDPEGDNEDKNPGDNYAICKDDQVLDGTGIMIFEFDKDFDSVNEAVKYYATNNKTKFIENLTKCFNNENDFKNVEIKSESVDRMGVIYNPILMSGIDYFNVYLSLGFLVHAKSGFVFEDGKTSKSINCYIKGFSFKGEGKINVDDDMSLEEFDNWKKRHLLILI